MAVSKIRAIALRFRVGAFLSVLALLLAGCAIGDYRQPVEALASAATSSQQALSEYSEAITTQVRASRRQQALAAPNRVAWPDGDCISTSMQCRLNIDGQTLTPTSPIPNLLALLAEIKNYTDGLKAIVESDTRAKVETSLASANGSLQNLAKLVERPGINLEGFAAPVTAAAGWIAGVYIDHLRYEALKTATRNANPLIKQAVPILERVAAEASRAQHAMLAEVVSTRNDEFRVGTNEGTLTRLMSAAEAYENVLRHPPAPIFKKLAEAHDSLTRALNNRDISLDTAFAQLQSLKSDAEKLKDIVNAFVKASNATR